MLAVAVVRPSLLAGLNRMWMGLGSLMNRVTIPLVMAFLYYGVVTPIALIMRIAHKDPLRLWFDAKAGTYWIQRDPPGPPPDTMRNQF